MSASRDCHARAPPASNGHTRRNHRPTTMATRNYSLHEEESRQAMEEAVALVQGVLEPLRNGRKALNAVEELKTTLRGRYGDYSVMIEALERKPDKVIAEGMQDELKRLTELFTLVADILREYTAAPGNDVLGKFNINFERATPLESISAELDRIDADVMRQLNTISLKGATLKQKMKLAEDLGTQVDRPTATMRGPKPTSPTDAATIPLKAAVLPHTYIKRVCLLDEAVRNLTDMDCQLPPCFLVGIQGGGKTILASAIVRHPAIREHFRQGIYWVKVGQRDKDQLNAVLQSLTAALRDAPIDTPDGMQHVSQGVEDTIRHLTALIAKDTFPCLIVLDDVWERGVVDALRRAGLRLLVTMRNRSIATSRTGYIEVGDMTEDEAVKLLSKASEAAGPPGADTRRSMLQVANDCGRLPLALAIAGSMLNIRGQASDACSWNNLHADFQNRAEIRRTKSEEPSCVSAVLDASFHGLPAGEQDKFMRMAVLAKNATAPFAMLLNLWHVEVVHGGYGMHDLLLDYARGKLKGDDGKLLTATSQQAQYLGRLDVLRNFANAGEHALSEGFHGLVALWKSVEDLSGDDQLAIRVYSSSFEQLEKGEASEDGATLYWAAGRLLELQGKYAEAKPHYERSLAIRKEILGPDHPHVAAVLKNLEGVSTQQAKLEEDRRLHERSVGLSEKSHDLDGPDVAMELDSEAQRLHQQGNCTEAEPLYKRVQEILEKSLGPDHPRVATVINNRAVLLKRQGKYVEADSLYLRAIEIVEKSLGPDHPELAPRLNNRAVLLEKQDKGTEAEALYRRTQKILEKSLGRDHPNVAKLLNNRAVLLKGQGKYDEADPLYRRALEIWEASLGRDHPQVASGLNNQAALLVEQEKYDEAMPLLERALAIRTKTLGESHEHTVDTRSWLGYVRHKHQASRPKGVGWFSRRGTGGDASREDEIPGGARAFMPNYSVALASCLVVLLSICAYFLIQRNAVLK